MSDLTQHELEVVHRGDSVNELCGCTPCCGTRADHARKLREKLAERERQRRESDEA